MNCNTFLQNELVMIDTYWHNYQLWDEASFVFLVNKYNIMIYVMINSVGRDNYWPYQHKGTLSNSGDDFSINCGILPPNLGIL